MSRPFLQLSSFEAFDTILTRVRLTSYSHFKNNIRFFLPNCTVYSTLYTVQSDDPSRLDFYGQSLNCKPRNCLKFSSKKKSPKSQNGQISECYGIYHNLTLFNQNYKTTRFEVYSSKSDEHFFQESNRLQRNF